MKHIASITTLTLVAAAGFADAAAPAAAPASAWSQSANLGFTSDYIWRGITQNDGHTALQGGFDVAHTSGLSAGVWASTAGDGWDARYSMELDIYANYAFKFSNVDFTVGAISYSYEGCSAANFTEVNVSATYAGVTAKISKEISNAAHVDSKNGTPGTGFSNYGYYYELGYNYNIPAVKDLVLGLHYGFTDGKGANNGNNEDYSVALSYPVAGFVATVSYSNTPGYSTTSKTEGGTDISASTTAISLKKTF